MAARRHTLQHAEPLYHALWQAYAQAGGVPSTANATKINQRLDAVDALNADGTVMDRFTASLSRFARSRTLDLTGACWEVQTARLRQSAGRL